MQLLRNIHGCRPGKLPRAALNLVPLICVVCLCMSAVECKQTWFIHQLNCLLHLPLVVKHQTVPEKAAELLGPAAAAVSEGGPAPFTSQLAAADGRMLQLPGERMFDPSYAGYRGGQAPPSSGEKRLLNILDYGAVPDDGQPDSDALDAAIAAVPGNDSIGEFTVIYFPAGEYLLCRNITLTKTIVLRGAGKDATHLRWTVSMSDLFPNATSPNPNATPWAYRRMMIDYIGKDPFYRKKDELALLTAPTVVGSNTITISSTQGITPGMMVRIIATDPGDGSLIRYLYSPSLGKDLRMDISDHLKGVAANNLENEDARDPVRFVSRVAAVLPGLSQVQLERAVPYALQLAWQPRLMRFNPTLQNVGVEHMTLEHKWERYRGHFKEAGHNTLAFSRVSNCWVKDVRFLNADTYLGLEYVHFCTLDGVEMGVTADRSKCCDLSDNTAISCHHGIGFGHSTDVLFTNFQVLVRCAHDISLDWWASSSVFSNGWGIDLNVDFHRSGAHGNLISNVSCGVCTAPFWSSGAMNRGLHAGMKNVYWNYRVPDTPAQYMQAAAMVRRQIQPGTKPVSTPLQPPAAFDLPAPNYGAHLAFVGCSLNSLRQGPLTQPGEERDVQNLTNTWLVEGSSAEQRQRLQPQDLHATMRTYRLKHGSVVAPRQ